MAEKSSSVCSIPELRDKETKNSCYSWLILSNYSLSNKEMAITVEPNNFFETIQLPPLQLDAESKINACILSSPPGHPGSTTFFI